MSAIIHAVGFGNRITSSTDGGQAWAAVEGPFPLGAPQTPSGAYSPGDIYDGVYAPSLGLFAVGGGWQDNDSPYPYLAPRVAVSSSMTDWSSAQVSPVAGFVNFVASIAWSEPLGLFAAGERGSGRLATSPDGVVWTARTSPLTYQVSQLKWIDELAIFVAIGGYNGFGIVAPEIATSPDGINWTQRYVTGPGSDTGYIRQLTWSPEQRRMVAAGYNGALITSSDGITWTGPSAATFQSGEFVGVAWSPDQARWLAMGGEGAAAYFSPNGIDWTRTSWQEPRARRLRWSPEAQRWLSLTGQATDYLLSTVNAADDGWQMLPTGFTADSVLEWSAFVEGPQPEPEIESALKSTRRRFARPKR